VRSASGFGDGRLWKRLTGLFHHGEHGAHGEIKLFSYDSRSSPTADGTSAARGRSCRKRLLVSSPRRSWSARRNQLFFLLFPQQSDDGRHVGGPGQELSEKALGFFTTEIMERTEKSNYSSYYSRVVRRRTARRRPGQKLSKKALGFFTTEITERTEKSNYSSYDSRSSPTTDGTSAARGRSCRKRLLVSSPRRSRSARRNQIIFLLFPQQSDGGRHVGGPGPGVVGKGSWFLHHGEHGAHGEIK
jgi:hypothetical protein